MLCISDRAALVAHVDELIGEQSTEAIAREMAFLLLCDARFMDIGWGEDWTDVFDVDEQEWNRLLDVAKSRWED